MTTSTIPKKITVRHLRIDVTYELIETYYAGGDSGTCCDNCGKLITNIAKIKSSDGKINHIGLDCAETLTGIKNDFDFEYVHKARFATARQARATIRKEIAKGATEITAKTFTDTNNYFKQIGAGVWHTRKPYAPGENAVHPNWKQYEPTTWNNYVLPMISDLLSK